MRVVYILYSHIHQAIKVGYASDISSRISTIQISTPEKLSLMFTFEGGKELEQYFHERLKPFHIRGEWFKYNNLVKDFLLKYQEHQLEFFKSESDEQFKEDLHISEDAVCEAILDVVNSFNRKFSIPEIKKRLPHITITSRQLEILLTTRNFTYTQYGTCRTKYFTKEDLTNGSHSLSTR